MFGLDLDVNNGDNFWMKKLQKNIQNLIFFPYTFNNKKQWSSIWFQLLYCGFSL
jgi:hypothetical protein